MCSSFEYCKYAFAYLQYSVYRTDVQGGPGPTAGCLHVETSTLRECATWCAKISTKDRRTRQTRARMSDNCCRTIIAHVWPDFLEVAASSTEANTAVLTVCGGRWF